MTLTEYITEFIDSDYQGDSPFTYVSKCFAKNAIITDYGQIENKIYYLENGIVEVTIFQNDEVKTLDLFFPNSFFCSYTSLLCRNPSDVQISAFTNCVVEVIDYQDLIKAYNHSLLANKLGRIETEKLYLRKVRREKGLLTKSAEERYADLLEQRPEIVTNIPLRKISRYLGIRPESLSRIRKKLIS